jgi:trehalose 6-phosphate phosphatase
MEHLFRAWQEFLKDYRAAAHILLLSDYDGTLTPIVSLPRDALLSASVRQKLRALAGKSKISMGVISGRSIDELKALVGIDGVYYSGNHGLEIEGPGLRYIHPEAEAARATMKDLAAQLAEALRHVDGVIIQEKGLSVSVHYRLAAKGDEGLVEDVTFRLTGALRDEGEIMLFSGKKVWEIRPLVDRDKGKAVGTIAHVIKTNLQKLRLLSIFLGDDITDEDAFKVVQRPEGWSICVRPESQSSAAEYFLSSVAEVEEFLDRLMELK